MTLLDPAVSDACCAPQASRTPIAVDDAETLARSLKALADPTRLRLVSIIAASSEGEVCVCDLTDPVGLSQPTVSHHLKLLVEAGILDREKRGIWAYYSLTPGGLPTLASQMLSV